ncbi:glycosyltransferase family 4 protein [Natrarchaeobaculum aegyptiacum]|uniref:Glycosyl transferase family 1 n=1 Tax=Natrarchaeobaculum aegyptiacum TaxID=745377 RepID=A0A2Z2HPI4_9EURY|nr:glycosyltransferase family 4 protein [Natrarchaeobaculum aegyptiacum]ARS88939.1 hypothetical protein B1756_03675 [Natrarchaeobaculum aegyptiacum]
MTAGSDSLTIGLYYPKSYWTDASGKAIFVRELAPALADRANCVVYSALDRDAPPDESGVDVFELPLERGVLPPDLERFVPLFGTDDVLSMRALAGGLPNGLREHVEQSVDVLVTQYYLDDVLLSRLLDVPVVYLYQGHLGAGIGSRTRERLTETDHHLAISQATAEAVADDLGRRVDRIFSPGVDVDRFHPDATPAFEREEPVITYVGRLAESKGVFELVDAFAGLESDAHLCLIGDGEGEQGRAVAVELDRRIRDAGLAEDVTHLGQVPNAELHRYYAASDVVCYPTHFDGFGLVNVEAMACGTPVVSTRGSGVEEYAVDGENCLLVDPGDAEGLQRALDRVLSSSDLRDRLSDAGRSTAEEYSWDRQAASLLEYCRDVVSASASVNGAVNTR